MSSTRAEVECQYCGECFTDWTSYFDHLNSEHIEWTLENKYKNLELPSIRELLKK